MRRTKCRCCDCRISLQMSGCCLLLTYKLLNIQGALFCRWRHRKLIRSSGAPLTLTNTRTAQLRAWERMNYQFFVVVIWNACCFDLYTALKIEIGVKFVRARWLIGWVVETVLLFLHASHWATGPCWYFFGSKLNPHIPGFGQRKDTAVLTSSSCIEHYVFNYSWYWRKSILVSHNKYLIRGA